MKIIESFITSKSGKIEECEDGLFVSNDFISVIDGVTPKNSFKKNDKNGAQILVLLIKEVLSEVEKDISCKEFFKIAGKKINSFYEKEKILQELEKNPESRFAVNMVVYSKFKNEVWLLGDCQLMIDDITYKNEKFVDKFFSEMRSQLLEKYLENYSLDEMMANDLSRRDILPFIKRQQIYQNGITDSILSYPVIDGFDINYDNIKIIPVLDRKEIILASDGYPILQKTLLMSEEELKSILEEDPLCFRKYKSTKGLSKGNISLDDRTYIRFNIN